MPRPFDILNVEIYKGELIEFVGETIALIICNNFNCNAEIKLDNNETCESKMIYGYHSEKAHFNVIGIKGNKLMLRYNGWVIQIPGSYQPITRTMTKDSYDTEMQNFHLSRRDDFEDSFRKGDVKRKLKENNRRRKERNIWLKENNFFVGKTTTETTREWFSVLKASVWLKKGDELTCKINQVYELIGDSGCKSVKTDATLHNWSGTIICRSIIKHLISGNMVRCKITIKGFDNGSCYFMIMGIAPLRGIFTDQYNQDEDRDLALGCEILIDEDSITEIPTCFGMNSNLLKYEIKTEHGYIITGVN